jgi:hypothetical protein
MIHNGIVLPRRDIPKNSQEAHLMRSSSGIIQFKNAIA